MMFRQPVVSQVADRHVKTIIAVGFLTGLQLCPPRKSSRSWETKTQPSSMFGNLDIGHRIIHGLQEVVFLEHWIIGATPKNSPFPCSHIKIGPPSLSTCLNKHIKTPVLHVLFCYRFYVGENQTIRLSCFGFRAGSSRSQVRFWQIARVFAEFLLWSRLGSTIGLDVWGWSLGWGGPLNVVNGHR